MPCIYLIDWVSFSTKIEKDVEDVLKLIGLPDNNTLKWIAGNGRYGYRESLSYNGITIYSSGVSDAMGIMVDMSGTGCRAFEERSSKDFQDIFKLSLQKGYNFTRLDIALDDKDELLPLERIYKDTENGNYTGQFKTYMNIGGTLGQTVQHGRKGSETMVRIYDKAAQLGRQSEGHWVRCEIQLRKGNAHGAATKLALGEHNISELYGNIVKTKLRYLSKPKKSKDTNKRRWKTAPYWQKLIETAERIKLYERVGEEYNLSNLDRAISGYIGAISAYIDIFGSDHLDYVATEKVETWGRNPKYDKLVEQYKKLDIEDKFQPVYTEVEVDLPFK